VYKKYLNIMNIGNFTDPRDGNMYRTIQIGGQCWLAENLKYLPSVCPATCTPDNTPKYYIYDYQGYSIEEAKKTEYYLCYGVIYNWYAALQASPPGWHLPTDQEWYVLTETLIKNNPHIKASNIGFALRSCRQVGSSYGKECNTIDEPRWDAPIKNERGFAAFRRRIAELIEGVQYGYGTDEFGFAALPGGKCNYGGFYRKDLVGFWWSASEASTLRAWCRQMSIAGTVVRYDMSKNYGYNIRCIKD
jgi:uncharacterized protein (TIGR02145 family)